MHFQIFLIFITIVREINFSVDFIQHDRFHAQIRRMRREREAWKESSDANDSEVRESSEDQRGPPVDSGGWNLLQEIQWMLEYNQYTYLLLFMNLFHLLWIVMLIVRGSIYASLPNDRDPETLLHINPILMYLDSIWMHDLARNFEQPAMFNRLMTLYCIQFSLLRLRALYARFRAARVNRHDYKHLNIIQLQMAAVSDFVVSSSQIPWYFKSYNHRCDFNSVAHKRRHSAMKRFTKELRKASKVERHYFYNQIEFDTCFVGQVNRLKHNNEKVEPSGKIGHLWSWLKRMLALKQPGYRCFVPEPYMPLDRQHVLAAGTVYLCALFTLFGVFLLALTISLYPELEKIGFDATNIAGTLVPTLKELLVRPKLQYFFVETTLFLLMIAVNAFDNGLLVFSSAVSLSRAHWICLLLRRQVSSYRNHLTKLADQIERKKAETISTNGRIDLRGGLKLIKTKELSVEIAVEEDPMHDDEESHLFMQILANYRQIINPAQVYTINDELDYILDLIGILEQEFTDNKKFFTFYIDMNIIFGSICSAVVTTVISSITCWQNSIIWCCGTVVCVVPLIVSLLLGASNESSFRAIYKNLIPLLGNELNLLNPRIMHRIYRFSGHLNEIENRSFLVLRNFPLTFGSMTSILGWIATGNLLLQRYLVR